MFQNMNLYKKIYFALWIIMFAFGSFSCSTDDECRKEKDVNFKIDFYTKTTNPTSGVVSKNSLNIDSIWVKALDKDSFIYKNRKSLRTIILPLKKFENQTDFIIRFNNEIDTISIFHTNNENYYLSLDCGCIVTHTIQEAVSTNHYIKSLEIINTEINTTDATHLQIFH